MPPASRILLMAILVATASTMAAAAPAKANPAPAADTPGAGAIARTPPTDPIAVLKNDPERTAAWRRGASVPQNDPWRRAWSRAALLKTDRWREATSSERFTNFCDLLQATGVDTQIRAQQLADSSATGLTILAPTDAAFEHLKPGTFSALSEDGLVQMMLYCVLPRYYSVAMLFNLNGEVSSEASGHAGPLKYNVSTSESDNQVNFTTGVKGNSVLLRVGGVVWNQFPLAIYLVDKLPLPHQIFGPHPPTEKKSAGIAQESQEDTDDAKIAASSFSTREWILAAAALAAAVLGRVFR